MACEQFPVSVGSFSSEYGSPYSTSNVIRNVCGTPSKMSFYGDNWDSATFRHYGKAFYQRPSYKAFPCLLNPKWFPYTDFMECSFSIPVMATAVKIYENFFPGSVKRILATSQYLNRMDHSRRRWQVLWEQASQSESSTDHQYCLNLIEFPKTLTPVDTIRIELDASKSEYYPQIDAIKLIGEKYVKETNCNEVENIHVLLAVDSQSVFNVRMPLEIPIEGHDMCHNTASVSIIQPHGIDSLPSEIIMKILGFLNVDDLTRSSRINKLFHRLSRDPVLYTCINLRPFYRVLFDQSILNISKCCSVIQKLDLSWLGSNNQISTSTLCSFLRNVPYLSELRLSACQMLASSVLETLAIYCSNLILLDISYCNNGLQLCVSWLTNLKKLKYLDVSHTLITTSELLCLLNRLKNLEWLNLGSPSLIADQDAVINSITKSPCGALRGIQLWNWDKLNFSCISQFLHFHGKTITELDLGFCLSVGLHSDILPNVACACPNIMVLILTAHNETTDAGLIDLSRGCLMLEQLDICGSKHITYPALKTLILACTNLSILDVSYCLKVSVKDVANLQKLSSTISIKDVATFASKSQDAVFNFDDDRLYLNDII
ncbi:hypothetical protein ACHWQZ_G005365 [Mnemiopsis leidyi]